MSQTVTGVLEVKVLRCAGAARAGAVIGALSLAGLVLGVAPGVARAEEREGWFRFGGPGTQARHGEQYDQTLAKQWETNPPRGFPTLSRDNIGPMKVAVKRYSDIVAMGGWRVLPPLELQPGTSHPAVALLRQRLAIEGDLRAEGGPGEHYDAYVERAVKRFQVRHGLTPSGIANKQTIAALNVPAQARLRQVKANLERLQGLASGTPKRYVLVNIPAAQIEAVDGDRIVSRHSGVVGKLDRPTPVLRSAVHELNFNPVWHLPPTVIEKDLIPKGQEMARTGKSVLVKYGIDAYDGNGKKLDPSSVNWSSAAARGLTFRQNPGPENPMGFVKINFHNSYSVYMHDTPSQTLFGRNFRAASSGCVRVQNIHQLAAWMLQENGDWSVERVRKMQETGERLDVKVKKPVPLYFAYITAWATEDGMVHFRRDLYLRDGVGLTAANY
jgi:murein L,D-transpeptidase YcbB/YkuD